MEISMAPHRNTGEHVDSTPKRRSASTWSRTGCITCKQRRKKCDLGRPECANCSCRGVPCGGYTLPLAFQSIKICARRSTAAARPRHNSNKTSKARIEVPRSREKGAAVQDDAERIRAGLQPVETEVNENELEIVNRRPPVVWDKYDDNDDHDDESTGAFTVPDLSLDSGATAPHPTSPSSTPSTSQRDFYAPNLSAAGLTQMSLPSAVSPFSSLPNWAFRHLQYFEEQGATRLLNLDAGSSNPVRHLLIPRALESGAVLNAVCAVSARHQAQRERPDARDSLTEFAAYQYFKAVCSLRAALLDPGITSSLRGDDTPLYIALLLCKYEIIRGSVTGDWKAHLDGLDRLLKLYEGDSTYKRYGTSFIRYHRTVSEICQVKEPSSADSQTSLLETPQMTNMAVDSYSGCAHSILQACSQISGLASSMETADTQFHEHFSTQVFHVVTALGTPDIASNQDINMTGITMQQANRLFFVAQRIRYSSFVFLHSVLEHVRHSGLLSDDNWQAIVRRIPYTKAQARDACLEMLADISLGEHCEFAALVLPLFLTGCELEDDERRFLVLERLTLLERSFGLGNIARTKDALMLIWQQSKERQRQRDTTLTSWWKILNDAGWNLLVA